MQRLVIPEDADEEGSPASRRCSYDVMMKRPSLAAIIGNSPEPCRRCGKTVYLKELLGPINGGIYHESCFKCKECDIKLTLQAYFTSDTSLDDGFVYCKKHVPKMKSSSINLDSVNMKSAMKSQANLKEQRRPSGIGVNIGADAAFIKAPIAAQKLRHSEKHTYSRHNFNPLIIRRHEESLLKAKRELEQKHRQEEERLLQTIEERRKAEAQKVEKAMEQEWEVKLRELTSKFDKQMEKKKVKDDDKRQMTVQYEREKEELTRTLRIKKTKERQTLSSAMLPNERALTSDLIKRQSEEMLKLIASKDQELQTVIAIDIEENGTANAPQKSFGEMSTMTDDLPLETLENNGNAETTNLDDDVDVDAEETNLGSQSQLVAVIQPALRPISSDPPGPSPPSVSKRQLYADPMDVFADLDDHVINIAEEDQASFTDLIYQLTKNCDTELEKARALFRWITVKDLSVLGIEASSNPDTPLGILRGIKIGTETYHVLFMRLCSYAGIHCREIKGFSKSVGYEPGMSFEKHNFTNTWNAVYLDGNWRLIQCNWAARHLVFHRDMDVSSAQEPQTKPAEPDNDSGADKRKNSSTEAPQSSQKRRGDQLRYQYDEHYFLTDPEEFIAEFFPFEPAWQLLPQPITVEEFEQRPFVRSAFFEQRMRFPRATKCILEADVEGRSRVEILMDDPHTVVCHYQLRYADERLRRFTYFEGQKLDRFVVFQVLDDRLLFDIHIPTHQSPFFFEVFAAPVDPNDPAPMQQIKLKCICKFLVACRRPIVRRMNPLPPSAALSGEWGPSKAMRHFQIKPLSHGQAVVTETDNFSLQFWIPEQYLRASFSASLHAHHANSHLMCSCVTISLEGNVLTLIVTPPATDQYSVDLFMHRPGASMSRPPSHICKYLLNCTTSVQKELRVPDSIVRDHRLKPGPTPLMKKLGISLEGEHRHKFSTGEEQSTIGVRLKSPDDVLFAYRYQLQTADSGQDHTDLVELSVQEKGVYFLKLPHIVAGVFNLYLGGKKAGSGQFDLIFLMRIEREARSSMK